VLTAAPGEDDGALVTDVDAGANSKLDVTLHRPVELGEHFSVARHVVHRARVEVLALKMVISAGSCAEERMRLGLI
jgi:hypothetical protein